MDRTSNKLMNRSNRIRALIRISKELEYIINKTNPTTELFSIMEAHSEITRAIRLAKKEEKRND